jgi:adenylate cyclase
VKLSIQSIKQYFIGEGWHNEIRRRLLPAFWIGLMVTVIFGGLYAYNFFDQIESRTLDWRFGYRGALETSADNPVVIVAIDDQTLNHLNLRWPVPRSLFAKAIDRLSEAGAKVVGFDFVFSEDSPEALKTQDRILGEAIARSKSWVVLAGKILKEFKIGTTLKRFETSIPSVDYNRTHVGYVNIWPDADDVVRHVALVQKFQNKLYFHFDLKILDRYLDLKTPATILQGNWLLYGSLRIPAEQGVNMLINYRGGPGMFKIISLENILDDSLFSGIKATGVFKDKIVLVGPTFAEAQDIHTTPFSGETDDKGVKLGQTAGVEIHADILDTILSRSFIQRLPVSTSILWIFILVMLTAFISIRLRPLVSPLVMLVIITINLALAMAAFSNGNLIAPLFLPTLAVVAATLTTMVFRVLTEERRSHHIKSMFSRYVSPKVVEEMVKNPKAAATLGGNKQIVTVMFSDIRNFTTMSEQLQPEQVVELLNEYFQDMTDVIFAHDGTVDKFIGDAIMAVFGAPVAHDDDPLRAVKSGLDMLQALETLNAKWAVQGRRTIAIGVGINTGDAIVGNMGSTQAMGYTVIGDTVNLASRLEGLNKELKTSLLISESTYRYVKDHIEATPYSGVKVKGKAEEMTVYAVTGLKV